MEIPDIGGLPAHPLIVHLPVVLVPLATVGAVLMLVKPGWRRAYEIPTACLAVLAALATQLALMSGEQLEDDVRRSELIERHSQIAEQARPFVFAFAAVMVAVVAWDLLQRRRATSPTDPTPTQSDASTGDVLTAERTATQVSTRPSTFARVAVVLTALGVVLGVASTVQVYRTGHSGATATWQEDDD